MTVTEVCHFTLKEEFSLETLKDPEGPNVKALETLSAQPGCEKISWGLGIEDPKSLFWFVEWDKLDSHETFKATEIYPTFVSTTLSALTSPENPTPIKLTHYPFPSSLHALLSENPSFKSTPPKLEYFWMKTIPQAEGPTTMLNHLETFAEPLKTYQGGVAVTFAPAVEDETVFLTLALWPTVQVHMEFRETENFAKMMPVMRTLREDVQVMHVDMVW
ncbi:hypothetical protein TWF694_010927 [Orbilia ellipsospora]|uniref:ABM domain-containing protein n=1 Tax=Orbilia ellipsospora TaxID=2528407 RepID=A0AAV9XA27_9PEZI